MVIALGQVPGNAPRRRTCLLACTIRVVTRNLARIRAYAICPACAAGCFTGADSVYSGS